MIWILGRWHRLFFPATIQLSRLPEIHGWFVLVRDRIAPGRLLLERGPGDKLPSHTCFVQNELIQPAALLLLRRGNAVLRRTCDRLQRTPLSASLLAILITHLLAALTPLRCLRDQRSARQGRARDAMARV